MPAKKLPPGDRPLKTLERIISKSGLGSRKEARSWIAAGHVELNGVVMKDPDHWVDLERDSVTIDGQPLENSERTYLLLHKPAGYITTRHDPERRPTVYDLLEERDHHLVYVGRLDSDTSGLLILTSDTAFAERLTNPEYKVPKTYRVEASILVTDEQMQQLRDGIELGDGVTRPAVVSRIHENVLEVTIIEGRNRQVRRMIEALGGTVTSLVRTAIGPVTIGVLPLGKTRPLTAEEVAGLAGNSHVRR